MKYAFGPASLTKLDKLNPRLRAVVDRAMSYQALDITVVETLRTPADEAVKVEKGLSATMNSKHLPGADGLSRAVDLAPYPVVWSDIKKFGVIAGLMLAASAEMGVKLRWGGNWDGDNDFHDNKPEDPGHFELA